MISPTTIRFGYQTIALAIVCVLSSQLASQAMPAKPVKVTYNGFSFTVETQAQDVAEFLLENFGDYTNLTVSPSPESSLARYDQIIVSDTTAATLNSTVAANLSQEIKKQETPPPPPTPKPTPPAAPPAKIHSGLATWYKYGDGLTTASRDFPIGSRIRVVAVKSGKSVDVTVNDYGPQAWTGIALDLNYKAFETIAPLGAGKIQIKYFKL